MLSKTERDYLSGVFCPSYAHKRVLDHRIKKKINEFYKNELPLIQKFSVNDSSNNVTEFSNNKIICEAMRSPIYEVNESLERGTNPRPNAYEAFALPG
jgi:hypothetical protein